LQHLSKQRALAVVAVHEAADVSQAHVAALELRIRQHTDATGARIRVAIEREVHLLHAVALGSGTECRLGALRGATEENAIFLVELHRHGSVSSDLWWLGCPRPAPAPYLDVRDLERGAALP